MTRTFAKDFVDNVLRIETFLKCYYDITHAYSAAEHLIDEKELQKHLPMQNKQRAAVFLLKGNDETFVSVYFDHKIREQILTTKPYNSLNHQNLDAFCVLVEEISHFHLILTRVLKQQKTKEVELEWQGEIDKMLLSAHLIEAQHGSDQTQPLFEVLFSENNNIKNTSTYEDANFYARKFWFKNHKNLKNKKAELKENLKSLYYKDWQEKYKACG